MVIFVFQKLLWQRSVLGRGDDSKPMEDFLRECLNPLCLLWHGWSCEWVIWMGVIWVRWGIWMGSSGYGWEWWISLGIWGYGMFLKWEVCYTLNQLWYFTGTANWSKNQSHCRHYSQNFRQTIYQNLFKLMLIPLSL